MRLGPAFLKQAIFKGLTQDQIASLLALANEKAFQDRDTVLRINEHNKSLFLVMQGTVAVKTATGDTIATIGEGGVFGEISIVDAQPASASILSQGNSTIGIVGQKELRTLLDGDHRLKGQLMENLARILAARLRAVNAHLIAGRMDD